MTQLTDKHWAVEVPAGSINFNIDMGYLIYKVPNYKAWVNDDILADYNKLQQHLDKHKGDDDYKTGGSPLPPGAWRFLFTTGAATEEDARKVVGSSDWHFPDKHIRFVDYKHPYDRENKQRWGEGFGTAIESLASLIRSKGLDDKTYYAIIEKL